MLTKNIKFKNFIFSPSSSKIKKYFKEVLEDKLPILETLKPKYKYSYSQKLILKYKKFSNIRIIGMGGSILGSEAIYEFLKKKLKKRLHL